MSSQVANRIGFGLTGAAALGSSWWIFRDLTDFSQWIIKHNDRDDFFKTFQMRHEIAAASLAFTTINTGIVFKTKCVPKLAWVAVNGPSLLMLYMGYVNPEVMMRARNKHMMYIPAAKAKEIIEDKETVIVTQLPGSVPRAFPDTQIVRPHVARVGELPDGTPATMTYCGLTGTGIVYELPNLPDGRERELISITQLENNLILFDKTSGHMGHQINGLNEMILFEKLGAKSYNETKRRPSEAKLVEIGMKPLKPVPTWRMNLGNFARTYPNGEVFINDYKEFRDLSRPVLSLYDSIVDIVFANAIHQHNTCPEPIFPTIENIDPRLPNKERVWGFNVGDDYVALTEPFVRDGPHGGVRNMIVGGKPIVASWDSNAASLGVWYRKSHKPVRAAVDVHGRVGGKGDSLERVETVKNGLFWFVWQNFFPSTRLDPES